MVRGRELLDEACVWEGFADGGFEPLRVAGEFDAVVLLALGEFVDGALLGDEALDHDGDAVADEFEFAEQVGVDEDRPALVFELLADLADVAAAFGVDAVGGFIEQDEFGIIHEGLGDADALTHALGVLLDAFVGPVAHADEFEELVDAVLADASGDARHAAVEVEDLPAFEVVGEAVVLGEVADTGEGGFIGDWFVEDGS